jgi:hypothetical protein
MRHFASREQQQTNVLSSVVGSATGFPVAIGEGSHPFPFRTRKLSPLPPMVLQAQVCGRVGHCRGYFKKARCSVEHRAFSLVRPFPTHAPPTTSRTVRPESGASRRRGPDNPDFRSRSLAGFNHPDVRPDAPPLLTASIARSGSSNTPHYLRCKPARHRTGRVHPVSGMKRR